MSTSRFRLVVQALLVRLRFPLLLLGVVLLIAGWPWLRNSWEHLTRPAGGVDTTVSLDTEYWCPMCPGVTSEWPAKCPVCSMALVRRQKGEATPLPDGIVARMQFSPYRVQLAGIRTTPAEYRPLCWEATFGGLVERDASPGPARVWIDVPEADAACVHPGQPAEVESEAFAGQTFAGRVRDLAPQVAAESRTLRGRVEIDDPRQELRGGTFVTARLRLPLTQLGRAARLRGDEWRDRTAVEVAVHSLPAFATPAPGLESLLGAAGRHVLHDRGLTLAIPAGAVIDTGERKVVFVERMPGMFDGLEVTLGRRCGDWYPVLRGLEAGDRVVTAGAFLLDAETRLNPSLAASYFGAAGRSTRTTGAPGDGGPERLSPEDQLLVAKQKVCPVTEEPLGSMGTPVRVVVEGRPVFICCKGCESALRGNPKKYLGRIPPK
jgi:hypothetical protein